MASTPDEDWPDDADGDVLRRLRSQSFDFSVPHRIEFEVDFESQPDESQVMLRMQEVSSDVTQHKDEKTGIPYFVVEIEALVTYEFVVGMQRKLTQITEPFGGNCEAWGLLH